VDVVLDTSKKENQEESILNVNDYNNQEEIECNGEK
jgi:hypothetical protein